MTLKYNLTHFEGEPVNLTVFDAGKTRVATKEHPNFDMIVRALKGELDMTDVGILDLFDVAKVIGKKFERLSERVTVNNGQLFFDGDRVDDVLADAILAFHAQGNADFRPLVSFLEKLMTNPSEHSRQNLYRWLQNFSFGIAQDGDFIAYKGVNLRDGHLYSVSSGRAVVNGEVYNGQILNDVGVVVEMPRSEVTFDPKVACSVGLHAGTWGYASSFASVHLVVKINPRDVVSVPTDAQDQKLRCCRYHVVERVTKPIEGLLYVNKTIKTLVDNAEIRTAAKANAKYEGADDPTPEKKGSSLRRPALKRNPAKKGAGKKAPKIKPTPTKTKGLPKYFEDFKKADFEALEFAKLRWLAKEWGVTPKPASRLNLVSTLAATAAKKRRALKAQAK